MIKLRLVPFLTTIAVTAALLFGGWFSYNQAFVQRPLKSVVDSLPGVVSAVPTLTKDALVVKVKLSSGADLRTIYEQVSERSTKMLEGRKLQLQIDQGSHPMLDSLWSGQLFTVAEAMSSHRYSEIPAALAAMEKASPGLKTVSSIDSTNVYVTLQYNTDTKYIILPREGEKMEAWPNA